MEPRRSADRGRSTRPAFVPCMDGCGGLVIMGRHGPLARRCPACRDLSRTRDNKARWATMTVEERRDLWGKARDKKAANRLAGIIVGRPPTTPCMDLAKLESKMATELAEVLATHRVRCSHCQAATVGITCQACGRGRA